MQTTIAETLLDLLQRLALAIVHRHDGVRNDEDGDLVIPDDVRRRRFNRVEHDEVVGLVLIDLRPLVGLARVLDRERMQLQILRDAGELAALAIRDVDPARLLAVLRDLLGRALDDRGLIAHEHASAHALRIRA